MKSKKLKTKTDKKNTINNSKDNLIPINLTKYGDNMSVNSVKTKEIMRCHICCKNFFAEEYYDHKKKYHLAPPTTDFRTKNTNSSKKNTNSSTKNTVSTTKKIVSNTKNIDSSTKINQKIDYNNIKKPDITTKFIKKPGITKNLIKKPGVMTNLNKKVPLESGYDNWKFCYYPTPTVNRSVRQEHVKTYHHLTNPRRTPVMQLLPNDTIPVLLLKHKNYSEVVGKRWERSIKEHIKAVHDFSLKINKFECDFCKTVCMNWDHFEVHRWSGTVKMIEYFECTKCPRSFQTKTQLLMHSTLHF